MKTTRKYKIPSETGKPVDYILRINYDQENDRFEARIPPYLAPSNGISQSYDHDTKEVTTTVPDYRILGETPGKVEEKFAKLCEDYREALTKTKRVITYRLQTNEHFPFESRNLQGHIFSLHWEVLDETNLDGQKSYFYPNGNRYYGSISHNKQMAWTSEREAFFKSVEDAMGKMIERCQKFLSDEKALSLMIDNHSLTPLLEQKKEEDDGE